MFEGASNNEKAQVEALSRHDEILRSPVIDTSSDAADIIILRDLYLAHWSWRRYRGEYGQQPGPGPLLCVEVSNNFYFMSAEGLKCHALAVFKFIQKNEEEVKSV